MASDAPAAGQDSENGAKPQPAGRSWLTENAKWIAVTIIIPLTTWVVGQWQERVATIRAESEQAIERGRQAQEAVIADARSDVSAMTALLPALSDPDPAKSGLAVDILQRLNDAQHGESKLNQVLDAINARIAARRNSPDKDERLLAARQTEAISEASGAAPVLDAAARQAVIPTSSIAAAAPKKPRLVFLQIFSDTQRQSAIEAQQRLRENGVAVPGIENVSRLIRGRSLRQPAQVRFFNPADLGSAKWVAEQMRALDGQSWRVTGMETSKKVPAGQLELWWPIGG